MSATALSSGTAKMVKVVQFDMTNYPAWLDSTYNQLTCYLLHRYSIPLVEGALAVNKPMPGTTAAEAEKELWEDRASQALVLIRESLGGYRWIVKESKTPAEAFKTMHDEYSRATKNDAVVGKRSPLLRKVALPL
jgi:hypothetical protein